MVELFEGEEKGSKLGWKYFGFLISSAKVVFWRVETTFFVIVSLRSELTVPSGSVLSIKFIKLLKTSAAVDEWGVDIILGRERVESVSNDGLSDVISINDGVIICRSVRVVFNLFVFSIGYV